MSQRLGKTKKSLVCNLVNVQVSTSRAQYTMHHSTKNDCYYPMAEKKYWKISLGVMVIPWKNIEFSSSEPSAPRKKIQYFSSGLPSPLVIFSNTFFQPQGNTPLLTRVTDSNISFNYSVFTVGQTQGVFTRGNFKNDGRSCSEQNSSAFGSILDTKKFKQRIDLWKR